MAFPAEASLEAVRAWVAPREVVSFKTIVRHLDRRDIIRVVVREPNGGGERTLFVKRIFKSHTKDGVMALLRHGRPWSKSRVEFENYKSLRAAGIETAEPISYSEDMLFVIERGSMIVTGAAAGGDLEEWLTAHPGRAERRRVLGELGRWMHQFHDKGFGFPDFFARHVYVDERGDGTVGFSLIDVARLDRPWGGVTDPMAARDLAALNVSVPLRLCGVRERVAFLRAYAPETNDFLELRSLVRKRSKYLLKRKKFRGFWEGGPKRT